MTPHSKESLAFHSLLRWKMFVIQILATSLMHFLFKRSGECTFWAQEWKGYSAHWAITQPPVIAQLVWIISLTWICHSFASASVYVHWGCAHSVTKNMDWLIDFDCVSGGFHVVFLALAQSMAHYNSVAQKLVSLHSITNTVFISFSSSCYRGSYSVW